MNLDIFPISATVNTNGGLQVGGFDLSKLAETFGTPLYIYDALTFHAKLGELQALLNRFYPGGHQISYASKAYLSLGLARKLAPLDIGLDTSSVGELSIALKGGFDPDRIHLHGNSKTESDLLFAIRSGIRAIVVDSQDELEMLASLAEKEKKRAHIWLRINPGISVDTHAHVQTGHAGSKFGLSISNGQADTAARFAANSRWLELTGLHTHLGSQLFNPLPYRKAINILLNLAKRVNGMPLEISPGGGWGVPYVDGMQSGNPSPWIEAICSTLLQWCTENNYVLPRLVIEPGRWLVAQAGVAIYRINATKVTKEGHTILALDGGMADNPRPSLYQSDYTACLVDRPEAEPTIKSIVAGKYCESGDILIPNLNLPEAGRGDLLAIPVSGAYQLSMASNYNMASRPAVLWLEDGEIGVLQKREDAASRSWWTNGE